MTGTGVTTGFAYTCSRCGASVVNSAHACPPPTPASVEAAIEAFETATYEDGWADGNDGGRNEDVPSRDETRAALLAVSVPDVTGAVGHGITNAADDTELFTGYAVKQIVANALRDASATEGEAVAEDDLCFDCGAERATVQYESGDDRCRRCADIFAARMRERGDTAEACARTCEHAVTGFASDLHEAYDNGARDCAKRIRERFIKTIAAMQAPTEAT